MVRESAPGRARRFLGKLAGSMEMPREVMLDVPRVVVIGAVEVHVENHQGILEFTPSKVRIQTRDGVVTVSGRRLKIGRIGREELVSGGRVDQIALEDEPERDEGGPSR